MAKRTVLLAYNMCRATSKPTHISRLVLPALKAIVKTSAKQEKIKQQKKKDE